MKFKLRACPRLPRLVFTALLGMAVLMAVGRPGAAGADAERTAIARQLFARENLVAWCIVPFDKIKRGPEARAAMLERLGFKRFAYDWRAEHIPTFDDEIAALKRHGVKLEAFYVSPGEMNATTTKILDALRRNDVKTDLWASVGLGPNTAGITAAERERRIGTAVAKIRPLADEAAKIGCTVALYNHGGWIGEPENQIAVIERLKQHGVANVGIVYNLHHGHDHLDRFAALLARMLPYLHAVNLNGMDKGGDKVGRKIVPLGQGSLDLDLLRTIVDSGYRGPIGILGHTDDDAEDRLRDNLDGLAWLLPQLEGKPPGPRPKPRTEPPTISAMPVAELVTEARRAGDAARGAEVFADAKHACLSCHKVGSHGGAVGPDLSAVGKNLTPEQIVESVLWPARQVKPEYAAVAVATSDGRLIQGYDEAGKATATERTVRVATTGESVRIARADIEEVRALGTLMPAGLEGTMTPAQLRDLVRFLMDLGNLPGKGTDALLGHVPLAGHGHAAGPVAFPYHRGPLRPELWPNREHPVNRDRIYDFYAKEAEFFLKQTSVPPVLPAYPGLDGGVLGHWGNQNDTVWTDGRWNETDLGSVLSGGFRGAGAVVPKGVCVRLGDRGELAVCFNPETLCYEALWQGGFLRFSPKRHGFLEGVMLDGTPLPRPEGKAPDRPFVYHGFYRHGNRVIFAYRVGDTELLDAPWVKDGRFTRVVAPAKDHPLTALTRGGPPRWPQVLETRGKLGRGTETPYVVDTIEPPFENPWKSLMFFGDHDFLDDGTAFLCTMQGDVWRVEGLDASLEHVRWRRFASGIHHALGLVVADGQVHVLGRDQITRLHDLDGDGEADFHECVNNAFDTTAAGDFITGLQRDATGRFYIASSKQGLLRITPDGRPAEVLATGIRNPDGLGLSSEGVITVPSSEGEWVPASMICEVRPGGHYGHHGPLAGRTPDLPLVYLPRGLDNSSGGQVFVTSDRWGPLQGQLLHFSFGAGTAFLVLREQIDGQPQGAVVPLAGDFLSGVHRGRFNPVDGQLYVSGMAGWGSYTPADGCFQRVRYTGAPVQLPVATHVHENGVLVTFSNPVDRALATAPGGAFAQAWNYRYSQSYGSPELSPRHAGILGHDPVAVRSVSVLGDGRSLFIELPDIQPVNQLHLHLQVDPAPAAAHDLFLTVHKLAAPFTGFAGYRPPPSPKTIAAHPIRSDLAMAVQSIPNRWRKAIANTRRIRIEAGKNLTFSVDSFSVRPGEPIKLTFANPDVVPHNWALIKPGSLPRVGDLANKIIAEPDAVYRHYIPRTDDVLAYTDIVNPQEEFTISFVAPAEPGRYPFLCTFPGHWMVMNGIMNVQ